MKPHLSTVAAFSPGEFAVSPDEVARYAGGSRYRAAAPQQYLIGAALDRASRLVAPAFVYSVREVAGMEAGYARLADGSAFPLPQGSPEVRYLAFCVCTIGPEVEKAVRDLTADGNALEGLFLDSAGVAYLDALAERAQRILHDLAKERHLYSSCGMRPGCGETDISAQELLFSLVDASLIGVRLNESCLMIPAKSLSFFTKWRTSSAPEDMGEKCASCELRNCLYRKVRVHRGGVEHAEKNSEPA